MTKKSMIPARPSPGLRDRAEEGAGATGTDIADRPPQEIQRLIHDLRVRQIELETQNEELRGAQAELTQSHDRFNHLYDFAPVGYVTFTGDGIVLEANLTLAAMLGVDRGKLVGGKFTRFVAHDARDALYLHQRALLGGDAKQVCELTLRRADGTIFMARLESIGLREGGSGARLYRSAISDITERVRTEAALHDSEDRLRLAVDGAGMGTWDVDMKIGATAWNPPFFRIMGYQPGQAPPSWEMWRSRIHPDDLERVMAAHKAALESRGLYNPEHRIVRQDNGEIRWIAPFARFIYDDAGAAVRFVGVGFDITERKRAEAALRESEERFRASFDNAAVGIVQVALDGQFLGINDKFCQIVGYSRQQLSTKSFHQITHPGDIDANLALLKRTLADEIQTYGMEKRYIRGDGAIVWVHLTVALNREPRTHAPLYFISVVQDITARKRAEAALRRSENSYRALVQTGASVILGLTPEHRIFEWNQAAERVYGWSREEALGQDYLETFVPEELRRAVSADIRRVLAGKSTDGYENEVVHRDGSRRTLIWDVCRLLDGDNHATGVLAIGQNITERQHAEEQLHQFTDHLERRVDERTAELRASQEQLRALAGRVNSLQEAERAELARELHDEFGAAMTALKVDLHWMMARLPKPANGLEKKAATMSNLIDETVESIRRTATLLRPRLLDDFGLVAAIEWQIQDFQRRTGIRCVTRWPEEIALDHGIATALFRILQEALTNVTRHARATEVTVRLRQEGGKILLEVNDNGVGITRKRLADRKSFGLFGMQERAYAFGGRVRIERRRRQGTTVTVEIPLVK